MQESSFTKEGSGRKGRVQREVSIEGGEKGKEVVEGSKVGQRKPKPRLHMTNELCRATWKR